MAVPAQTSTNASCSPTSAKEGVSVSTAKALTNATAHQDLRLTQEEPSASIFVTSPATRHSREDGVPEQCTDCFGKASVAAPWARHGATTVKPAQDLAPSPTRSSAQKDLVMVPPAELVIQ